MDKAKILRLCNDIEMLIGEIYNTGHTMQNCDYEAVDKRLKAIVAETTAPPKTNGDRIRQMTDEELAKELTNLIINALHSHALFYGKVTEKQITVANLKWLKQEAHNDE